MKNLVLTKMSSKGQIVIPKSVRERFNFEAGENFAIYAREGTIVLKRVEIPLAKEVFGEISKWGIKHARNLGIKESDIEKILRRKF